MHRCNSEEVERVTREMLEEYCSMIAEISEIKEMLKNLEEDMTDHSTILDYKTGFPRPQAVIGIDERKYLERKRIFRKRIEELEKSCEEVESFIESIQDSLTRRVFRMKFIEGKTMETIGRKVGLDRSSVSRKIDRYLKSCTQNNKCTDIIKSVEI